MATAVLPPFTSSLGWSVLKSAEWNSRVSRPTSGKRRAATFQSYPLWKFLLTYSVLHDDPAVRSNVAPSTPNGELRDLMNFYNLRRGEWEPFFLTDPTDFRVTAQTFGTGDGTTKDFPLLRALSGSLSGFTEPVGGVAGTPGVGDPDIMVNGVAQGGGSYTLNTPYDGWVHFNSAPGNGSALSWNGRFYFRVAFAQARAEFENMMYGKWQVRQFAMEQAKV